MATALPRALLTAPLTSLPTAIAEVERVANLLHPDLAINDVTLDKLLNLLAKEYRYVHFACHAGPDGIQLSNGQLLQRALLVQLLRRMRPDCVFFNTCSSLEIAMELHDALPDCTVIATILDIEDQAAYVTGSLFAQAIADGKDYSTAYELSRPSHDRKYILLNGSARLNSDNDSDDQKRLMLQVWSEMQRRMEDSDQLSLKSLDAMRQMNRELADIKREFGSIRHELTQYQRRPSRKQAFYWSAGYMVFCLVLALAYKDFRDLLDFNALPTLIISMMLLAGAFMLFVLGLGFRFSRTEPHG